MAVARPACSAQRPAGRETRRLPSGQTPPEETIRLGRLRRVIDNFVVYAAVLMARCWKRVRMSSRRWS